MRAYRLDILTTFGGDQGQDFLTVKDMVLHHTWTLIGIKTSIAPFFQGPIYLYLLYPFFFIFKLHPIAGAVAALFYSTLSIILLYITVYRYFSKQAALYSTALFAVIHDFIVMGNTPLYQNFLPLFLISGIFIFLYKKRGLLGTLLLGFSAGICIELHLLAISITLAYLIYFLIWDKDRLRSILTFAAGIIFGISPTILFELRHSFLNTHLLLDYLRSGSTATSSGNIAGIVGFLVFGLALFFLKGKYKTSEHLLKLINLAIITVAITAILSLKLTAFQAHYALPVWILLIILFPAILMTVSKKFAFILCAVAIGFSAQQSLAQLQNNHGYAMPSGWTLKKIELIAHAIVDDTRNHKNFNVASLLDGNTRTYPLRYSIETKGANPGTVEQYPEADHLYVVWRSDESYLSQTNTWEITSLKPWQIGYTWNFGDDIYLYRLDRLQQ